MMLLNVGCELTATSWTKMNRNHEYVVWHQTVSGGMVAHGARWNRVSVETVGWKKEKNYEFANSTLIPLETLLHKPSWKKNWSKSFSLEEPWFLTLNFLLRKRVLLLMSPRKILHSEKLGLLMNSMWGSAKNAIGGLITICVFIFAGFGLAFLLVGEFVAFFFSLLCRRNVGKLRGKHFHVPSPVGLQDLLNLCKSLQC